MATESRIYFHTITSILKPPKIRHPSPWRGKFPYDYVYFKASSLKSMMLGGVSNFHTITSILKPRSGTRSWWSTSGYFHTITSILKQVLTAYDIVESTLYFHTITSILKPTHPTPRTSLYLPNFHTITSILKRNPHLRPHRRRYRISIRLRLF